MKSFHRNFFARHWAKIVGMAAALGAAAAQAQFVSTAFTNLYSPSSLATDPSGAVYITDSGASSIIKFIPSTGASSIFVGLNGSPGTNDGLGQLARFNNPVGILYVPALNGLVVVDQNNQDLRLVTLNGSVSTLAGVPGVYGFRDGAASSALFEYPSALALDSSGANLYISDSGNNAIRVLNTATLQVSTLQPNNGYTFKFPEGLSIDGKNNLWIADTRNDVIAVISNVDASLTQPVTVVAGQKGVAGYVDDAYNALNARFRSPGGVLWNSDLGGVLVADTGNNVIRDIYPTNGAWAVQTLAGAGAAGLSDGAPLDADFDQPQQIFPDLYDTGFYIVDKANNAVRTYQPTAPQPPVSAPVFGFVTFPPVGSPPTPLSVFTISSNAVFDNYNPPRISVKAEPGSVTYITYGATPANPLDYNIPTPSPATGTTPAVYLGDNLAPEQSAPSIIPLLPDVTVYAISYSPGRRPSPVVSAHFKFVCGNPIIEGLNAASITLEDSTSNALIFYTLDGSVPDDGSTNHASVGPITPGQVISIDLAANVTLNARAFAPGFQASGVSSETLSLANYALNELTLGFPTGQEGSSIFRCTPGQHFCSPVTLTLLPDATMYSLQFDVTVTNLALAPTPPGPSGYGFYFNSMLEKPITNGYFTDIPPAMFDGSTNLISGQFTNNAENLLGIGWIERATKTNLYPTTSQDLITYSQAKDDQFTKGSGKVIVGGYTFLVPSDAPIGSQYQVQLVRPSATADGVGVQAAPITTPTNGSYGIGSINGIKNITVVLGGIQTNELSYLVGDANDFRWFNVGDFGDDNLDNSDVEEVFQSAVYNLNTPVPGTDLYDSLDSANSTDLALFTADGPAVDASIDNMLYGDGVLNIADVFVTFRRSLDPALLWVRRYHNTTGTLIGTNVANGSSHVGVPPVPAIRFAKTDLSQPHTISIAPDSVVASGSTVVVPVRVLAADPGGLPIRDLMFDLQVQPLDGSPAITIPVAFNADASLGAPNSTLSQDPQDVACLWLGTNASGFSGAGIIGTVTLTLPSTANANSAYLIQLQHLSASPNGLAVFTASVQNGLVTLSDRSGSSWNDRIPDSWRLLHFGTISDPASAADADPDGDGASNWQEYVAGTDPLNPASVFKLQAAAKFGNSAFSLQWPSVAGKTYILQSAASPSAAWTTITNLSGTGANISFSDTSNPGQARFYRAIVQ